MENLRNPGPTAPSFAHPCWPFRPSQRCDSKGQAELTVLGLVLKTNDTIRTLQVSWQKKKKRQGGPTREKRKAPNVGLR